MYTIAFKWLYLWEEKFTAWGQIEGNWFTKNMQYAFLKKNAIHLQKALLSLESKIINVGLMSQEHAILISENQFICKELIYLWEGHNVPAKPQKT